GDSGTAARGAGISHRTAKPPAHAKSTTTAPAATAAPAAQQPSTATAGAPAASAAGAGSSGGGDPAALNDQGFQRLQAGDYAGAIAPLRASVQGYRDAGRTNDLNYAFALYNLGVALNRSGDPAAAIPYLQERLRNPNQRATVQRELDSALAKLNGKPAK